jgi:hypothetical protein
MDALTHRDERAEFRMKNRLAWIQKTKLKVLAWLLGITLATVATISVAGLPWIPVVGMAVAAAAVSVGKTTARLMRPTCLTCGHDLSKRPIGAHGAICDQCGAVWQARLPRRG